MDIVDRAGWGARTPNSPPVTIAMPTPELWLHHTAGSESGGEGMRAIQRFHQDTRGYNDIAYSFVVDPYSLTVYEGRGAGIQGGHTKNRNSTSHAICVMGNFDQMAVSSGVVDTVARLVAHGHTSGWWPAALSGGHRDVGSTACPGSNLYAAIRDINARASRYLNRPEYEMVTEPKDVMYFQRILAGTYRAPHDKKGPPYDIGQIDGVIGPKTKWAISDWQRRRGIEITGTLNLATVSTLQSHANRAYASLVAGQ